MPTRMLLLRLDGWLCLPLFPFLDEDVICDHVPGIMNAGEEQQQRRRGDDEEGKARVGVRRAGRYGSYPRGHLKALHSKATSCL